MVTLAVNLFKPVDAMASWIAHWLSPLHQRRIGMIMILMSLPLIVLGFFLTKDPQWLLLYQMSAFALLFGGLAAIIAAVPSE